MHELRWGLHLRRRQGWPTGWTICCGAASSIAFLHGLRALCAVSHLQESQMLKH